MDTGGVPTEVTMLHEFLTLHRDEIIARTRERVATRTAPRATEAELQHGVPLFMGHVIAALRRDDGRSDDTGATALAEGAARHGAELRRAGFTVAQAVHDYGDICQVVTEMAIDKESPISPEEFRTLNLSLDQAIAGAVTEYARQHELARPEHAAKRLGVFAHEARNLLGNAILAFEALKAGTVGVSGSTGGLVERNLRKLREVIDRSLAEVRLEVDRPHRERLPLTDLMEDAEVSLALDAHARGLHFTAIPADTGTAIEGDRHLLSSALANLLQNAFKFTRRHGHVVLRSDVATSPGRVLIEVEDECGGLPPGGADVLFSPFEQRGADRSGLGLGLAIALRSVEASGGTIRARNLPGKGCVFTIDLPASRAAAPVGE